MNAQETSLLQAYVDGELDAAATLEFEARLRDDADLRAACERLRELSTAMREHAAYHAAPPALAARIRAALPDVPREAEPRAWGFFGMPWFRPAAVLAAGLALGLGIGVALMRPDEGELIAREVIASHVRATLSDRLIDIASSDQHTVKPWLSAHLPFSAQVTDLSGEGFPLAGARLGYIEGKPVAVLVYKRRRHTIDVFVWPGAARARRPFERDGFNVARLDAGGLQYWVVSDLNREELEDFTQLLARHAR
jgi:anti-sigma factor RsiW